MSKSFILRLTTVVATTACAALVATTVTHVVASAPRHTSPSGRSAKLTSRAFARHSVRQAARGAHLARRVQAIGQPYLKTAPATDLNRYFGITLSPAPSGALVVSAGNAERVALGPGYGHGVRVLEDVLAVVHTSNAPGIDGCLCWIVSEMPSGGVSYTSGEIIHLQFDLVLVDGRRGTFLTEAQRGPATEQPRG